ncbi:cache domain-containing protein [bacterium]|nr:cache domain-containing protein [bacterium]
MKNYLLTIKAFLSEISSQFGVFFQNRRKNWLSATIILFIPSGLMAILFICSFFFIALPAHKNSLMTSKREMIRELTNTVWMLLSDYEDRARSGELSVEEAQTRAKARIRSLLYGREGKDYFWIMNTQSRLIMHPYRSDLEGKVVDIIRYSKPSNIMEKSRKIGEDQNAGYIQYNWQRYDNSNNLFSKLSYVKKFDRWGWIIGTGIYLDDIQMEINAIERKLIYAHSGIFIIISMLSILIVWQRKIEEIKRIEAENSLRQSEERHRSILESIVEGYLELDLSGNITFFNNAVSDIVGYSSQELSGMNNREYMSPETAEYVFDKFNQVYKTEKPEERFEFEIIKKDGKSIFLESSVLLLRDHTYQKTGFRVMVRDINNRKLVEMELIRLQNLLNTIFDSYPSAMLSVNAELRITKWNRMAQEMANGFDLAENGKTIGEIFPHISFDVDEINQIVLGQRKQATKKVAWRKKSHVQYLEIKVYPLLSKDTDGAVIRMDDITERLRMEELMIQTEKMISIGGLAAGMAHEINNPLAGIIQNANVMRDRLTNTEIPANNLVAEEIGIGIDDIRTFMEKRGILRMVTAINESGRRISEIVNNMLNFARKSDSTHSYHDINELLDKTLELAVTDYNCKKQYDFKKIEIQKEYDKDIPPVFCASEKIQQVLLNLFRNATQAMQEERIKKPRIIIRTYFKESEKMVCLEIEDNGPGMEKETSKRIFEPFFTTKPVGLGMGLGLSVSYFIITENHGGEMTVESSPGFGARFIIRLPLERGKSYVVS